LFGLVVTAKSVPAVDGEGNSLGAFLMEIEINVSK
jgi:hypothetical protein